MMAMCSKKAYFKPSIRSEDLNLDDDEVDPNVVSIKFDCLKENVVKIHQGDPTFCKNCNIVLNKFSQVTEEAVDNQFEQQKIQVWICEFCGHKNHVQIEREEIPVKEDVVYLVQSVQEVQHIQQDLNDSSIVFCIDNSGSMSTTSEVKGQIKFRHGLSQEEYEMLKQFIEPGDEQQIMPGKNKNVTHVSRKQCVLAAIEQQIAELKKNNPNKVIGLVTFNNEVVVFGDGTVPPVTIAGDRLFKVDEIRQQAKSIAAQMMKTSVKNSADLVLQSFEKLREKGQTALGPAMLASLELAKQGKPGSMVIVCTDGLANLGVGSFEGDVGTFYDDLSKFAAESGIVVSVVTIRGEGCKMEVLSKVAENTNGTVTRVKPEEISNDFANILKDELVATKLELTILLHRALKFRNEEDPTVTNKVVRKLGNATVATIQTFEYQVKPEQQLKTENIDINQIKKVPFQIQVVYTNLHGDKLLRVVTNMVDTTQDLREAEREAKVEIIHQRMAQKTANIARGGNYEKAEKYNSKWDNYVQSNEVINQDERNQAMNMQYDAKNKKLKKAVQQQSLKSEPKPQSFGDKVGALFGFGAKQPEPQKQQQQLQQVNQPANLQKKQVQKPPQKEAQKMKSAPRKMMMEEKAPMEEEEADDDQDMADLLNFEQGKY